MLILFLFLFLFLPIYFLIQESKILILPFFCFSSKLLKYLSFIFYIFLLISIIFYFYENKSFKIKNISKYFFILIILHYISIFGFFLFFFRIISPFFLFCFGVFHFLSTLYLQEEFATIFKKKSFFAPYICWSFYLVILSISIFVLNQ